MEYIADLTPEQIAKIGHDDPYFDDWEHHPFWTSEIVHDEAAVSHPAMAGVIAMEEEMTDEERAETYKQRGNDTIKVLTEALTKADADGLSEDAKKELRERHCFNASVWYSQALDCAKEAAVRSVLLSNRAHCQFLLQNWRNCLMDCQRALKENPKNVKALYRGGYSAIRLGKGVLAVEMLTSAQKISPSRAIGDQLALALQCLSEGTYPSV